MPRATTLADPFGERADLVRRQCSLVAEGDPALAGELAERAKGDCSPFEVGLVSELRTSEERHQNCLCPELGGPPERPLHVVTRVLRHGRIGVGDAAEVAVLPEHEARDGEPVVAPCTHETVEAVRLSPRESRLDAGEPEARGDPEKLVFVRSRKDVVHDAALHGRCPTPRSRPA
jgi:hypothetical protein